MPGPQDELLTELLQREAPKNPFGAAGVMLSNRAPEDMIPVQLPAQKGALKDQGAFDRFLGALIEGLGLPSGDDMTGTGNAGLAGYGLGSALTGGLAAVIPPKAAKLAANKVIKSVEHPQVREILEWMRDEKKIPRTLGQMTKVEVGPIPGAYAAANSELEYRVQDLAMKRLRSQGIANPTDQQIIDAQNDMREALNRNLSDERIENLSKVYRVKVDPTAHSNYFDLANSLGHEVRHGAQIMQKGTRFQPEYQMYEMLLGGFRGGGPDPNPFEEQAYRAGDKVQDDIREWFREKMKQAKGTK